MGWVKGHRGYKRDLLENSIDAYVLALETVNRISVRHRIESFSILICNAWELLLKAKILLDSRKRTTIFRKSRARQPRRTLSLRDCLSIVFPNDRDPIRRNIEQVAELRDDACHFCIKDVPINIMALFQACVLNYHGMLEQWFGVSLANTVSMGMMTIVFDMTRDRFAHDMVLLRKTNDVATLEYLLGKQQEIETEYQALEQNSSYALVIKHEFEILKSSSHSTVAFQSGGDGVGIAQVHIAKDSGSSHPHLCSDVVAQLNSRIEGGDFSQHDVVSVVAAHGIEKRPDLYFRATVRNAQKQYSQKLIDWMVERHRQDDHFFQKAREKYRVIQKDRSRLSRT